MPANIFLIDLFPYFARNICVIIHIRIPENICSFRMKISRLYTFKHFMLILCNHYTRGEYLRLMLHGY